MISVARLREWTPNSSRSFVFEEPAIIPPWILIRRCSKRSWILIRLFSLATAPRVALLRNCCLRFRFQAGEKKRGTEEKQQRVANTPNDTRDASRLVRRLVAATRSQFRRRMWKRYGTRGFLRVVCHVRNGRVSGGRRTLDFRSNPSEKSGKKSRLVVEK